MVQIEELFWSLRERVDVSTSGLAALESILTNRPDDPIALYDLSLFCRRIGAPDLWRSCIDLAIALPHHTHEQIYRRAHAKLTLGDWSGWRDAEARVFDPESVYLRSREVRQLRWEKESWDGKEDLTDIRLLILADGGFGDCLQMLRFIPQLVRTARSVMLGVQPELVTLVRHNFGNAISVLFRDFELPDSFDRYAWGLSLPALCGDLPPFRALTAPSVISMPTQRDRRQVGVCWAGSSDSPRDTVRSVPIAALEPLFARDDLQCHSLQVGSRASECHRYAAILPSAERCFTFADTAEFVSALDLVITVDTSIAHLAGAMGVPTLLLLDCESESRWGLSSTTPWYPSVHLVRQTLPGDWSSVVNDVMVALNNGNLPKPPCVR
jgi:hypothetical protein